MLVFDTKIGNSSQATQVVVPGSHLQLSPTFLRYCHWTHPPRLSGCLISIGILKKDRMCPRSTRISSGSFFPACSTTTSTQCLPTSHLWTPAVTPKILVCGAPGCRAPGGWSSFLCRLDLRPPYSAGFSSLPSPPLHLALILHYLPKKSSFNP